MKQSIVGIYTITNKENGKQYIGSSCNIAKRWGFHTSKLQKNKHFNKHLQAAWNKYGSEAFKFEVLEECSKEELLNVEQRYIDGYDFSNLYNLTLDVYGGGSDCLKKPIYLLDLQGNILKTFECYKDAAEFLNRRQLTTNVVNSGSIINKTYRVATPDFYTSNLEVIRSWKPYSNLSKLKRDLWNLNRQLRYEVILDGISEKFYTCAEVGRYLKRTTQRIQQMVNTKEFKESGKFESRWYNFIIKKV